MSYPVDVSVEYGDGARSRGLAALGIFFPIKLLVALPHLFILYFLQIGAVIGAWIGYWGIALNGSLSPGIARFIHNYLGWNLRITSWLVSWRDEYPIFALEESGYAAKVIVTEPTLERSRGLAVAGIVFFFKGILLIPHFFILAFIQFAALVAGWFALWVVAFTGVYPDGVFNFTVGTMRWYTRTYAWLLSITAEYPPFQLSQ